MYRFWKTLVGTGKKSRQTRRASLAVEALESRDMPSMSQVMPQVFISGNSLEIRGRTCGCGDKVFVIEDECKGITHVTFNDSHFVFQSHLFNRVNARFPKGNNILDASGIDKPVIAFGGKGNDIFIGGGGADYFDGRGGCNQLDGGAGIDFLTSTGGMNLEILAEAHDRLVTTEKDTVIYVPNITGPVFGTVSDSCIINNGVVTIFGSRLADRIFIIEICCSDQLHIIDGEGHHLLPASQVHLIRAELYGGNDRFDATGDDSIPVEVFGGNGNDVLLGSGAADRLFGEAGIDRIRGGRGADYLEGGAGSDIVDLGPQDQLMDRNRDVIRQDRSDGPSPGPCLYERVCVLTGSPVTTTTSTSAGNQQTILTWTVAAPDHNPIVTSSITVSGNFSGGMNYQVYLGAGVLSAAVTTNPDGTRTFTFSTPVTVPAHTAATFSLRGDIAGTGTVNVNIDCVIVSGRDPHVTYQTKTVYTFQQQPPTGNAIYREYDLFQSAPSTHNYVMFGVRQGFVSQNGQLTPQTRQQDIAGGGVLRSFSFEIAYLLDGNSQQTTNLNDAQRAAVRYVGNYDLNGDGTIDITVGGNTLAGEQAGLTPELFIVTLAGNGSGGTQPDSAIEVQNVNGMSQAVNLTDSQTMTTLSRFVVLSYRQVP